MGTYVPDPTNHPSSYTEPTDGQPRDAASVDAMLEGEADNIARLQQLHHPDMFLAWIADGLAGAEHWDTASFTALATQGQLDIPACVAGDKVFVSVTGNVAFIAPPSTLGGELCLYWFDGVHAGAKVTGTTQLIPINPNGTFLAFRFAMCANLTVAGPGTTHVEIRGLVGHVGDELFLAESTAITVVRYRVDP